MFDLNSLLIFAKVAETNSFSEAARQLRMPVSTVSRRILDLENALGVRLVERSTRSLRLTAVGRDVLEHARAGVGIHRAVATIAAQQARAVSGLLRLSVPPSIGESLLAPIITAFLKTYPDVRVEVVVTERFVEPVEEGIDLAFRFGQLKNSALRARKLLSYRHLLLASPRYLQANPPPQAPADLHEHRLLTFAHWRADSFWTFIRADGAEQVRLAIRPTLSMNDFSALAAALVAGEGIGEMPPIVAPHLLRQGDLVEVMPGWRLRTLDLSLVHTGSRHVLRASRLFADIATRMAPQIFPDLPT